MALAWPIQQWLVPLLDALIADLPEERRPSLAGQGTLIDDAVASAIPRSQRAASSIVRQLQVLAGADHVS